MKLILIFFALGIISCSKERVSQPEVIPPIDTVLYANVIYLDFNGELVSSDYWNGGREMQVKESGMNDEQKTKTVLMLATFFSPFQVTITSDESIYNAAQGKGCRVIITESSPEDIGSNPIEFGVANTGELLDNMDAICFVFSSPLHHDPANISRTAAHEVGHTLGLWHQTIAYCIMSNPYGDMKTNWITGINEKGVIQDDIKIISETFKLKTK